MSSAPSFITDVEGYSEIGTAPTSPYRRHRPISDTAEHVSSSFVETIVGRLGGLQITDESFLGRAPRRGPRVLRRHGRFIRRRWSFA